MTGMARTHAAAAPLPGAAFTVAALLRTVWPRHTAKRAARAAGRSFGTVKAWVSARFVPSADDLLRMAANNREFRDALMRELAAMDRGAAVPDGAPRDRGRVGVPAAWPARGGQGAFDFAGR